MRIRTDSLKAFWRDERGEAYVAHSYLGAALAISIPLGLMFYSIYESMCSAGRYADFMLALF